MKKRYLKIGTLIALAVISPACAKESGKNIPLEEAGPQEEDISEEPVSEPTSVMVESSCDNILFPLNAGNNWVYQYDSVDEAGSPSMEEFTWTVSDASDSGVVLESLFNESGTLLSTNVACTDGTIQSFPVTSSNIVFGDTEGSIEYDFISGIYLPSEAELIAGNWKNSWETVINSSGTIISSYGDQTMEIVLEDSPITINWQILETNVSVTVPAGTFDNAILVNQELVYEINSLRINTGDTPIDVATTITANSDQWFVPYLGLVKTEIKSTSISLFGSDLPWEGDGSTVLKSTNLLSQ